MVTERTSRSNVGIMEPAFGNNFPASHQVLALRRKLSASSVAVLQRIFAPFSGRDCAISLVVAVSRADRSLIVFREGFSQGAGLAR